MVLNRNRKPDPHDDSSRMPAGKVKTTGGRRKSKKFTHSFSFLMTDHDDGDRDHVFLLVINVPMDRTTIKKMGSLVLLFHDFIDLLTLAFDRNHR